MNRQDKMKICPDLTKRGHCSWGDKCKFVHPQGQHQGGRHHPYSQGQQSTRPSDDGGHGPQRRHDNRQQQQQHGSRQQASRQQDSRQQQQKGGAGGRTTPMSPTDSYPKPPSDIPSEDQQQAQQQQPLPPPQPPQRLQQGITALDRARAMCRLLGMGNPGPLVTPETEASAINAFACGGFFRETPFADSIEKFLPPLKQQ